MFQTEYLCVVICVDLVQSPDILGFIMIVWPIVPPGIGDRIQEEFECKSGLIPCDAAESKLNSSVESRERLYTLAREIADHIMGEKTGWGPWPEDLQECLSIGLVLGVWLESGLEDFVTEMPESELTEFEEESRRTGLNLEQLVIRNLVAAKEAEDSPADWWRGGEA